MSAKPFLEDDQLTSLRSYLSHIGTKKNVFVKTFLKTQV